MNMLIFSYITLKLTVCISYRFKTIDTRIWKIRSKYVSRLSNISTNIKNNLSMVHWQGMRNIRSHIEATRQYTIYMCACQMLKQSLKLAFKAHNDIPFMS